MDPLEPGPPSPLTRRKRGRWLGGVCAGIAASRGVSPAPRRVAFAAAALVAGLGVLVYLACWLIIPAEGEDGRPQAARAVVVVAQACAAVAGLATLAALAAAATIFGFGWVVAVTAAVALGATLAAWPRIGPGGVLLPLAVMVAPSLAMAAGDVHIAPRTGAERVAPASAGDLPHDGYTSGLAPLLVDLRHTALPSAGVVRLAIDAGIRRTIVALPHDRCVRVSLSWHVQPFAARLASFVARGGDTTYSAVIPFGQPRFDQRSELPQRSPAPRPGPTLALVFESAGGSLIVRDYPDDVDPRLQPQWPGYAGEPEPRPDTTGIARRPARELLRAWRARHREQVRSLRRVEALLRGPCFAPEAKPKAKAKANPASRNRGGRP